MDGRGTVYAAGFFRTKFVETSQSGVDKRREVIIFPAIAVQGWPVLLVNTNTSRPTEPERYEIKEIVSFTDCWRVCEMFARNPAVQVRWGQGGNTLADVIAAIKDGDRDYDLLHRLRVDFALNSAKLLAELDILAELMPPQIARDKILAGLRALVYNNETYEDCLSEFSGCAGDAA